MYELPRKLIYLIYQPQNNCTHTAFLSKTHSLNNYIIFNYDIHGLKQNSRTPQPLALIYTPAVNYPAQYKVTSTQGMYIHVIPINH